MPLPNYDSWKSGRPEEKDPPTCKVCGYELEHCNALGRSFYRCDNMECGERGKEVAADDIR